VKGNKVYRNAKTYGDGEKWRQPFLTSALDGDEWPGPLKTVETALGTDRIGGWLGP